MANGLDAVRSFLLAPTPTSWVDAAVERLPELLLDHANCELKAASTALGLIYRYPERSALVNRMSRIAREELRHFEQVRRILQDMCVPFERLSASRYAGKLREALRQGEPQRMADLLLVAALIEARSCERFAAIAPRLPDTLQTFYLGLLASEARHFEEYLALARTECGLAGEELTARLGELQRLEAELILAPDPQFRFHSGSPIKGSNRFKS
ncbi:MAG TPA: tRNA isopentenyl-2-thiomethyl-A-37 hydroxylase MiaE [Woeseiaceae bacterium]|nr:tRNA isopentenyl-2-thiomethyl-A-37 hydroxylase MiaE [Woeseiaceae bacterium]